MNYGQKCRVSHLDRISLLSSWSDRERKIFHGEKYISGILIFKGKCKEWWWLLSRLITGYLFFPECMRLQRRENQLFIPNHRTTFLHFPPLKGIKATNKCFPFLNWQDYSGNFLNDVPVADTKNRLGSLQLLLEVASMQFHKKDSFALNGLCAVFACDPDDYLGNEILRTFQSETICIEKEKTRQTM